MAKCVLIVDDDPAQRRILEETVKRFGYESKTANDGEQALALLEDPESSAISVVLLDLVMPELDDGHSSPSRWVMGTLTRRHDRESVRKSNTA